MGSAGIENEVLNTAIFDCPALHRPLPPLLLSRFCLQRIVPERWKAKQEDSPMSGSGMQMPLAMKRLRMVLAISPCIRPNWVFILPWSVSGLGCKFGLACREASVCCSISLDGTCAICWGWLKILASTQSVCQGHRAEPRTCTDH